MHAHHAPALSEADRGELKRIPVTALPRTLLDLSTLVSTSSVSRAIERAEQLGIFDLAGVEDVLSRTAGHHGVGKLRRALDVYREPAFTRSQLERRFLALIRDAGLPQPSANFFVEGYEVDVYWPDARFGVELDGYEHHKTRAAFERDRLRQEDLKLAGVEMTRITAWRLGQEPRAVIRRIRRLLDQRADSANAIPSGMRAKVRSRE